MFYSWKKSHLIFEKAWCQPNISFFLPHANRCGEIVLISRVSVERLGMIQLANNLWDYQERVTLIGQFGRRVAPYHN